jgi:cytochrome c oxidase subunit 2
MMTANRFSPIGTSLGRSLSTALARRVSLALATLVSALVMLVGPAAAAQPEPWGMRFQEAATQVMSHIQWFETFTLIIITAIVLLVLGLLIYVCWRFSEKRNPTPSKTTHHFMLEVAWTVVPIIILVVIAIPSFRLLFEEATIPPSDLTIKVTGYQWYWGYEYPDNGEFDFLQIMLSDAERLEMMEQTGGTEADYPRLLAVDNAVVVPVDATVRLQITAADVLHAFAMPAFGVKMDAVPGRLNETWFRAEREGMYYGQCSELCGTDHAFMPIAVQVVSADQFDAWTEMAATDVRAANEKLAQLIREADGTELAQN